VRLLLGHLLRDTRGALAGRDLPLAAAGATLYGAVAAVPSLLVAIAAAGVLLGDATVMRHGVRLASSLPDEQGASGWVVGLFRAGLSLSPVGLVLAAFMASAYGGGLQRALRRFAPPAERDELPPSWWTRVLALPVLGLAPLLLVLLLLAAPVLSRLSSGTGVGGVALASYLSLNLVWVITWLPLTWAFRVVAPGRPAWRAAAAGAVVTGAFVSGFLQGFVLFLALPVDLGRPFGGLAVVGLVSGLLLWLWVLHLVFCIGYAFTWQLHRRFTRLSGQA
jgi:membrane protein